MADDLTSVALAFKDAEARKAAAEEAERAALAAAQERLVYDPRADLAGYRDTTEPHDTGLYAGTGIGALYGVPGSDHHLSELGAWRIGKAEGWAI